MNKQQLRERVWDDLEDSGTARFPFPPHGRIPNFAGADAAADRLADTTEWQAAAVLKANPDSPQRPVRRRALAAGKTVYVAVPRLQDEDCFRRLDPQEIDDLDHATTISGSAELGDQVGPGEMEPIDLVVCGSVAVTERGARVGKGEGYSDLEYGLLREFGLLGPDTPVTTTVHERQLVDGLVDGTVPVEDHDVPMDLVVTQDRVIHTDTDLDRPGGILWDAIPEGKAEEIPVLSGLRGGSE